MTIHPKNILITGGAGFISSHMVRQFVQKHREYHIFNLDALTYAGNLENLKDIVDASNYTFIKGDHAQAKWISVLEGKIQDVVVDLRKDSPTYKHHLSLILDSNTKTSIAHSQRPCPWFLTLSETARVMYKCDNYYNKEAEGGIWYDDGELEIEWKMKNENRIISEKNMKLTGYDKLAQND